MAENMGDIKASLILDISQAVSAYTAARQAHLSTVSALGAGEGVIRGVGQTFMDTAKTIVGGLMTATQAAGEFERKLDFFSAVSNATQSEYEAIRKKALQLGADTLYSADQIADSFTELAKSGVGVQDLLDGIGEAVAYLGASTDIPLAEAASSLTTILNTFAISADGAVDVVNKLAGAANSSSIDVKDLIYTMTYAGASAKTAGISFDDVNAAIAVLGERGIKSSKAGTGLRQMFDKLIAPTNKGKEALAELGIVLDDGSNKLLKMDGTLKPIPEVLDTLNAALAGLNASERIDILGQIFPITSMPTILNMLDAGSAGMARLNAEIGKTTAADIASKRLDNLSGDIEYLRGEIETFTIRVGSAMDGMSRHTVQVLEDIVHWFNSLDDSTIQVLATIAGGIAVFVGLAGAASLAAAGFLNLYQTSIILKDLFPALAKVTASLAASMKLLMAAIFKSPLGIIATAVIAVAAALTYFFTQTEMGQQVWSQFMAAIQQAAAVVMPVIQNLIDIVGNALGQAFQAVMPILTQVGAFLAGALPAAVSILATVFQGIISAIQPLIPVIIGALTSIAQYFAPVGDTLSTSLSQIAEAFAPVIQTVVSELMPALSELGAAFIGLLVPIGQLIASLVGALAPVFASLITDLLPAVMQLFTAIVPLVMSVVGAILQLVGPLINLLVPILSQLIGAILPVIVALFNAIIPVIMAVVNAFIPLIQTIVEMLIPAIQLIIEVITAVFTAIAPIIEAALNVVVSIIKTITALLKGDWEGVWNGILDILKGVWDLIVSIVTNTIKAVVDVITSVVNFLVKFWNTAWDNISSYLKDAWNNIVNGVAEGILRVVQFFQNLPNQIMSWLGDIGVWLLTAGRDLIQGFINGINDMIGQVGDAIGGIMDFVGSFFPHSPAERGPFSGSGWRQLLSSGGAIMLQFIDGMNNQRGALARQMDMIGNDITSFYDQVNAAAQLDASINMAMVGPAVDPSVQQLAQLNRQFDIMVEKSQTDSVALIPEEQLDTLANKIVQGFHSVRNADSEEAVLDVIRGTR